MSEQVFQQDLSQEEQQGGVFPIHLLMREKCGLPDKEKMLAIIEKHLGDVDCFCFSEKNIGLAVKKYPIECDGKTAFPMLLITDCFLNEKLEFDPLTRSQMWDCPESEDIIASCRYDVVAADVFSSFMDYKDRAEMLADLAEALVEIYPSCEAVYFGNSGKMFTRRRFLGIDIPREVRFIYYAVNVRFVNITGSDDKIVDSLGMSALNLPDVQYHYHDIDANEVVRHAYNLLTYIFDNACPIKTGDTIDGLKDGKMSRDVQWRCNFEDALVQPARTVIDVNTLEYAAGDRSQE